MESPRASCVLVLLCLLGPAVYASGPAARDPADLRAGLESRIGFALGRTVRIAADLSMVLEGPVSALRASGTLSIANARVTLGGRALPLGNLTARVSGGPGGLEVSLAGMGPGTRPRMPARTGPPRFARPRYEDESGRPVDGRFEHEYE